MTASALDGTLVTLRRIVAEITGIDDIGVDDELTAFCNSLVVIQCLSRTQDAFGVEVSFLEFFEAASTIRALATLVDARRLPDAV